MPALRRLLSDPTPRVRRMALHVLSCEVCKLAPLPREDDLTPLIVERALADPSINVRRHAALALAGCGMDRRVGAALESLLAQESDPALLRHARWALRWREAQGAL